MDKLNLNLEILDEERQKFHTNVNFRKGYKLFKGYTLPESFQNFQKEIEDFEVFDDDIWITTFPKCGTTWSQEMIWCITHDMDMESAKQGVGVRMPFIEFCCAYWPLDDKFKQYAPEYLTKSIEYARKAKRPRIIKTHLPFDLLPKQIQTFEKQPTIIHVYRNIKDVCVSYYHHSRLLEGYRGDFDLFWKLFLTGKLSWTPMIECILSYWQHRARPNFLFLRFEDMKKDLRGVVLNVCKFFNKTFSDEQIDTLVTHLSFDSMQKNEYIFGDSSTTFHEVIGAMIDANGQFFREGKTGGYKSIMSDEVSEIFDAYVAEKLKSSDLTFN